MEVDWKDIVDWVDDLDKKYGGRGQREMARWYLSLRARIPRTV